MTFICRKHKPDMKIDAVVAVQFKLQFGVAAVHIGNERIGQIFAFDLPAIPYPFHYAVGPDAETHLVAGGVVGHADMRKIKIAHVVVAVEIDQHGAIANGNISRHNAPLNYISLYKGIMTECNP